MFKSLIKYMFMLKQMLIAVSASIYELFSPSPLHPPSTHTNVLNAYILFTMSFQCVGKHVLLSIIEASK